MVVLCTRDLFGALTLVGGVGWSLSIRGLVFTPKQTCVCLHFFSLHFFIMSILRRSAGAKMACAKQELSNVYNMSLCLLIENLSFSVSKNNILGHPL